MSHPMHYTWVVYESRDGLQIGHRWVSHRSHMSQRWVALGSENKLQMNHITWIKYCYMWVANESQDGLWIDRIWVSDESRMGHIWVTHWLHFLIQHFSSSSKLTNMWPRYSLATLRMGKMNLIFDLAKESNSIVSLANLLWSVASEFFAHRVGETIHCG